MTNKSEKVLSPKQTMVKLAQLLRGLDNSTAAVTQHLEKAKAAVNSMGGVISSLGNMEAAKPPKAPKVAAVKPPKAQKVKKEPKAVASLPPKTKAAKPAKEPKVKAAAPVAKKADADRPALKDAIKGLVESSKEPMTAANIYRLVCELHGYWSRQSLYNVLKDVRYFTKSGDTYQVASEAQAGGEDAVDRLIQDVENRQETASLALV